MANLPPYADTTGDSAQRGTEPALVTGTPRWVKVCGIIAIVVVVLFIIVMLAGGGDPGGHGPGRH